MEVFVALPVALQALLIGLALLGLAIGLRWVAARRPRPYVPSPVKLPVETKAADAGVLVAQPGGRLIFVNERAREYFGLNGQTPNLHQMAQQARPGETFLELFV